MVKKKNKQKKKQFPFVSICTPTFNRRPFIPYIIKCVNAQKYPKHRMEWIIIDDGTDPIEDIVIKHPLVKYFRYKEKMTLGKKRNLMHEKCKGDIIVYMDDDDYYPSTRVNHAVETLQKNDDILIVGSSAILIYFSNLDKFTKFGPYGPNHATAGTFAFKKELLLHTKYDEDKCLAEEKGFLKDYSFKLGQLDPKHSIVCFSHIYNTFNKESLLEDPNQKIEYINTNEINNIITDPTMRHFYLETLNKTLINYEFGSIIYKPDVVKQYVKLLEKMNCTLKNIINQYNNRCLIIGSDPSSQIILKFEDCGPFIKKIIEENFSLKQKYNQCVKSK